MQEVRVEIRDRQNAEILETQEQYLTIPLTCYWHIYEENYWINIELYDTGDLEGDRYVR